MKSSGANLNNYEEFGGDGMGEHHSPEPGTAATFAGRESRGPSFLSSIIHSGASKMTK